MCCCNAYKASSTKRRPWPVAWTSLWTWAKRWQKIALGVSWMLWQKENDLMPFTKKIRLYAFPLTELCSKCKPLRSERYRGPYRSFKTIKILWKLSAPHTRKKKSHTFSKKVTNIKKASATNTSCKLALPTASPDEYSSLQIFKSL